MLALIINPTSGGGRSLRALPGVIRTLAARGVEPSVQITNSLKHATELTRTAADQGLMPVAFGGDGLVAAVASALTSTPVTMGVLPGGRANDFARGLGLPPHPEQACAVLFDGTPRRIDLGISPARPFIGIATCGLDSLANQIANATRLPLGRMIYAYGGLRALARWRPAFFTVTVDGSVQSFSGYTVAVANAPQHGGGMRLAPDASLNDGKLDVVMVAAMPKLALLAAMPHVFSGTHVGLAAVTVLRGREVFIDADRPLNVFADGESLGGLPMRINVASAALSVMVPAQQDAELMHTTPEAA
ncbi:MAG: diacylglycerol/lipid kinase family protein [Solirubrobacteraceae bacterium]